VLLVLVGGQKQDNTSYSMLLSAASSAAFWSRLIFLRRASSVRFFLGRHVGQAGQVTLSTLRSQNDSPQLDVRSCRRAASYMLLGSHVTAPNMREAVSLKVVYHEVVLGVEGVEGLEDVSSV